MMLIIAIRHGNWDCFGTSSLAMTEGKKIDGLAMTGDPPHRPQSENPRPLDGTYPLPHGERGCVD